VIALKLELITDKFQLEYKEDLIENTLLWENHCHAHFEMIAVLDGSVNVTIEGIEYRLRRGEAIAIPPLCYHAITASKKGEYKRITALFDFDSIPNVLWERFAEKSILIHTLSHYITDELKKICFSKEQEFYIPLAHSFMTEILYSLANSEQATPQSEINDLLRDVLSYIDAHLCERISLDELASHISRSKSSICHIFEEKMKISPKQYILQKKLALATQMIRSGMPPTSVAIKLGYDNYSNFYRLYKKHCSHPPAEDIPRTIN
jgi:AraC-like DNA-binding protein